MNREIESLKAFVGIKRSGAFLEQLVKKDVQNYGLNITEFAVLDLLYHRGQQPIQQIRNRILIASSSTTYVIDKLCSKDFVERIPDASDGRVTYASITPKGRELMETVFPLHAKAIAQAFESLDDEELALLRTLLKKIGTRKDSHD